MEAALPVEVYLRLGKQLSDQSLRYGCRFLACERSQPPAGSFSPWVPDLGIEVQEN